MKTVIICPICWNKAGNPFSSGFIVADYYEDFVVRATCPKGHEYAAVIQTHKFEALLSSSAKALVEGYTLEAVTSFAVAYERFIKFAVRIFCKEYNIDEKAFEENWKHIKKQSERQIGGFLFLYLLHFKIAYKINKNIPELRNKYIHQGDIPTIQEAENFGEMIYQEIYSISVLLKKDFLKAINDLMSNNMKERHFTVREFSPYAVAGIAGGNLFSLIQDPLEPSFKQALMDYKKTRTSLKTA